MADIMYESSLRTPHSALRTYWRPRSTPVPYILLVLSLLSIVLGVWLWGLLGARAALVGYDTGVFMLALALFLAIGLALMLAYVVWCAFTMRYSLEGDVLRVRCGGVQHVVPLDSVTAVYGPGDLIKSQVIGVNWKGRAGRLPGYVVGTGESPQLGRVLAVATQPASSQVFVVTPSLAYGLSPGDPANFIKQLNANRAEAGDLELGEPQTRLSGLSGWAASLWADRLARPLFLVGLALNALLFGYLSVVYANLPSILPLHWNAQAQIDRIGDPTELLRLPAFGLAVWLVNAILGWWALSRERAATVFLLAGAVAVQLLFAVATLSIVLRAQ